MILEDHIKDNKDLFTNKVIQISKDLNEINPDWLMGIMYHESRLDPHIRNKLNAVGLIQFMPDTAESLGTTPDKLAAMSNVSQLDYVYKYFKPYRNKLNTAYDLFLTTFFPAGIGKPDTWIIHSDKLKPETIAKWNSIFDLDKSNSITIGEYKQYLDQIFDRYGLDPYAKGSGFMLPMIEIFSDPAKALKKKDLKKKILIGAGILAGIGVVLALIFTPRK